MSDGYVARDDAAAVECRLKATPLRRPDHHFQRVARAQVDGSQRLERAKRSERAQVTVRVPPLGTESM